MVLQSRYGDRAGGRLLQADRLARYHQRPAAEAQRGAASQQAVAIADSCERAEAELGQLQLAALRAPVQLLDIQQYRLELERRLDQPMHERMEGEGVVRAGREAEAKPHHSLTLPQPHRPRTRLEGREIGGAEALSGHLANPPLLPRGGPR